MAGPEPGAWVRRGKHGEIDDGNIESRMQGCCWSGAHLKAQAQRRRERRQRVARLHLDTGAPVLHLRGKSHRSEGRWYNIRYNKNKEGVWGVGYKGDSCLFFPGPPAW